MTEFIGQAFRNTLATFVHKQAGFELLLRLDRAYLRIGEHLVNPPTIVGSLLLLRSHSAFRGGCRLAMSGQASDTFPLLRVCLEYALYALHVQTNQELEEVWFRRHDGAEAHRQVRRNFQHARVMEFLSNRDEDLGATIEELYERQ